MADGTSQVRANCPALFYQISITVRVLFVKQKHKSFAQAFSKACEGGMGGEEPPISQQEREAFPRKGEQTGRANHPVDGSLDRLCGPPGGVFLNTEISCIVFGFYPVFLTLNHKIAKQIPYTCYLPSFSQRIRDRAFGGTAISTRLPLGGS